MKTTELEAVMMPGNASERTTEMAKDVSLTLLQRKFSVAGLGSVWKDRKGYRNVPCLYEASEGRYLDLHWWDDAWYSYSRFAVTRK